jgi:dTDP-4-dehydrorhamnose reductase
VPDAVILRTAWVYSPFGANFVKTMLRLAETRDELGVVADQIGNPTSALDIADVVLAIARRLHEAPGGAPRGIFHMTGSGEASWADLARDVFAASAAMGAIGPCALHHHRRLSHPRRPACQFAARLREAGLRL